MPDPVPPSSVVTRVRLWARALKRDAVVVWLAAREPRVPVGVKLLAAAVAAYALSPIDLIPDFIPVLGYLDDLLLVPGGIWLVLRMIPGPLLAELRAEAERRGDRPRSRGGAMAILCLWLLAIGISGWWFSGLLRG